MPGLGRRLAMTALAASGRLGAVPLRRFRLGFTVIGWLTHAQQRRQDSAEP